WTTVCLVFGARCRRERFAVSAIDSVSGAGAAGLWTAIKRSERRRICQHYGRRYGIPVHYGDHHRTTARAIFPWGLLHGGSYSFGNGTAVNRDGRDGRPCNHAGYL